MTASLNIHESRCKAHTVSKYPIEEEFKQYLFHFDPYSLFHEELSKNAHHSSVDFKRGLSNI